jgi:HD-GYP domain-containing protein (c-di-GMP phosphodiesterase class II)
MIVHPQVPLHRLVLSLSEALDYVHANVADHQQRVAYVATNVARRLGFRGQDLMDLFLAAALHDIGLVGAENRVRAIHVGQLEKVSWHAEAGYELLKDHPLFARPAGLIRYHHTPWADGRGVACDGREVPPASHILVLADAVERAIDRAIPALEQAGFITDQVAAGAGRHFHPDCVAAFRSLARAEAFWLDLTGERIYSVLLRQMDWPHVTMDEGSLNPIAELFGRVVDLAGQWTTLHSAGVAASAVALSERLSFSPRERQLLRAAGFLHDLGKLSVPGRVLDKPGALSAQETALVRGHTYHTFRILSTIGELRHLAEWAAFHHERLDGNGYPFRHGAEELTLGSRIMAVADTFTALAEDRPYRKGMGHAAALRVLDDAAASGGLDGDVVGVLRRDVRAVDAARRREQAAYARKQKAFAAYLQDRPAVGVE